MKSNTPLRILSYLVKYKNSKDEILHGENIDNIVNELRLRYPKFTAWKTYKSEVGDLPWVTLQMWNLLGDGLFLDIRELSWEEARQYRS